ncbi:MAG TPA: hypothetical protein VF008_30300 [Niastella sp.]
MKSTMLALALFFTFCLSGFDNDAPNNFLTVGNKTHSLDFSEVANESYGINSKFEIDLINQDKDVTKATTYVYFSLTSNSTANLSNGVYQFSSATLNERLPFQFNGSLKVNNHVIEIAGGTISIENRKSNVDIHFILKLKNGDIANGIYRGEALKVDRSQAYN